MSNRLRLVCVIAVSFLTSAALAQGQSSNFSGRGLAGNLALSLEQSRGAVSAFPGQSSSSGYTFASSPKQDSSSQQQSNGNQTQTQNGNQNQSANPGQSQNQSQNPNNQGQSKDKGEEPPPKPEYLTYSVKKKSLAEQVKSGKALAVDFKSVPAGAVITVDGYFVGKTPTTAQIPLGKHLVSITKWGYESWSQELDVANGKDLSVSPKLHRDW
jgi:PEGA domain